MLFTADTNILTLDVKQCDVCGYDHTHVYFYRMDGYANAFRGVCPSTGADLLCVLAPPLTPAKS